MMAGTRGTRGTRRYAYLNVPRQKGVREGTPPFRGVPRVPAYLLHLKKAFLEQKERARQ